MTRRSIPFAVLAAVYLGVVTVLTLGPTPWRTRPTQSDYDVLSPSTWLDPDTWVRVGSPEFIANILLFVPLGLLLRLAVPRASWVVPAVLGVGLSGAIEVLQMGTARVSDPRDILANTVGALLGVVLAAAILAVGRRSRGAVERRGQPSDPRVSGERGVSSARGVSSERRVSSERGVSTDTDLTRAVG
jgi:glycopeptide antibiotics resistance protein